MPGSGRVPRRAATGITLEITPTGAVAVKAAPEAQWPPRPACRSDVIAALGGTAVTSIVQVQSIIGRHRPGDDLAIDVVRGAETKRLSRAPESVSLRTSPEYRLRLWALDVPRRHTAPNDRLAAGHVCRPRAALLLLQGGGCNSIDVPWAPADLWPMTLMSAPAARGFVTMRVRKTGGPGESEGPPCSEGGFRRGERRAIALRCTGLVANPAVDRERIFLYGGFSSADSWRRFSRTKRTWPASAHSARSRSRRLAYSRPQRGNSSAEIADIDILGRVGGRRRACATLSSGLTDDAQSREQRRTDCRRRKPPAHPGALRSTEEFEGVDHCGTQHNAEAEAATNCGGGKQEFPELIAVGGSNSSAGREPHEELGGIESMTPSIRAFQQCTSSPRPPRCSRSPWPRTHSSPRAAGYRGVLVVYDGGNLCAAARDSGRRQ